MQTENNKGKIVKIKGSQWLEKWVKINGKCKEKNHNVAKRKDGVKKERKELKITV